MVTLFPHGKRDESRGRKASDPKPAPVTAGRVAGLHLGYPHNQVFLSSFALPKKQRLKEMGVQMKAYQPLSMVASRALALLGLTVILVACGGGKSDTPQKDTSASSAQTASANASKLCVFSNDEEADKCQSGQISLFAPHSFGNEQLPVIFAAKYCDFNFPMVSTVGSVSCVFFKGRTII